MNKIKLDTSHDFLSSKFSCPYCRVYATMNWEAPQIPINLLNNKQIKLDLKKKHGKKHPVDFLFKGTCNACNKINYWICVIDLLSPSLDGVYCKETANLDLQNALQLQLKKKKLTNLTLEIYQIYPATNIVPPANKDMPVECAKDYEEARNIAKYSPRAAAALLRLCIQRLCFKWAAEKGSNEKNLNLLIGFLLKENVITESDQKILDSIRIVGNNAVHPGEMNDDDIEEVVSELFNCVNLLIHRHISMAQTANDLFEKMPKDAKKAVEDRKNKETFTSS